VEEYDEPPRMKRWPLLLAWVSPLIPLVVAVLLVCIWFAYTGGGPRKQSIAFHQRNALVQIAAQDAGFVFAVVSLFGIRSGRGRGLVVGGAVLGMVLNALVGVLACLYLVLSGLQNPWAHGGK
jgi:hypothetical protein